MAYHKNSKGADAYVTTKIIKAKKEFQRKKYMKNLK